jgi:hypothetical protein
MKKELEENLEVLSDRVDALTMMFCDLRDSMYEQSARDANREIYKRWSQLETLCHQLVEENTMLYRLANSAKEVQNVEAS